MELGPIQKEWIKSLREHPERQLKESLGNGIPEEYQACCLGEALCVIARMKGKELPFKNGLIIDNFLEEDGNLLASETVLESYGEIGLYSNVGDIEGNDIIESFGHWCLTLANDTGKTWPEIADFIEANPKAVFSKSV